MPADRSNGAACSSRLTVRCALVQITETAPFSSAFREKVGWRWASSVVGAGASLGIVASLLVAMLGQARYLCVIARARLVPSWLAKVHPSTGTPMNATIFLGIQDDAAKSFKLNSINLFSIYCNMGQCVIPLQSRCTSSTC